MMSLEQSRGVHRSVLLQETIDGLDVRKGDLIVDCTLNGGGHSNEILKRFGDDVRLVGIDADSDAIFRAEKKIGKRKNFITVCDNFRNLDRVLNEVGETKADKFLFDLGLSSDQLETSGRGFSFQKNEPLFMTFESENDSKAVTASQIVNEWSEETIASILKGYGEEGFARQIAKAIVASRKENSIESTSELVDIIKQATPAWYHKRKSHPATRVFQALRIAANDEISALEEGLAKSFEHLNVGGRIAVISFHSIEDRIVKQFFKKTFAAGVGKIITKKPIVPTKEEVKDNPRARSSKLRIIERII